MRIALIAPEVLPVPPISGGAVETYIDSVSKRFAQKHDVTLFSVSDSSLPDEEFSGRINYIRVESKRRESEKLKYLERILEHLLLTPKTFDVIELFNRPEFVLPIREAGIKTPLVLSMHNEGIPFSSPSASPEVARSILNEVTAIPTTSAFLGSTITRRYREGNGKIYPTHSGVDLDTFVPSWTEKGKRLRREVRNELGLGDRPMLLFVGRLNVTKGLHVILRAMPQVISKHPDVQLLVIGGRWFGNNEKDKYVRIVHNVASPWKENIKFLGWISYPKVARYFPAADLFVSAAQWEEPIGRVHCEAMAAGLPIIATNRGGIGEVVRDGINGILINDYEDPQPFAQVIGQLLGQPKRCRIFGEKGRQLAEETLSFDYVGKKIMGILEYAAEKSIETSAYF